MTTPQTRLALLAALLIVSCSSADGPSDTPPLSLGDKTVADLTDEEIEQICSTVRGGDDIECGMDTDGPDTIVDAPGAQECQERMLEMRGDEIESCAPAEEMADCWASDPCDREDPDWCEAACPEREACMGHTLDECEDSGACVIVTGLKWDASRDCYTGRADAYCAPKYRGCSNATTTTLDPDSECWFMNQICEVPEGWENERSTERSCPAEAPPLCP